MCSSFDAVRLSDTIYAAGALWITSQVVIEPLHMVSHGCTCLWTVLAAGQVHRRLCCCTQSQQSWGCPLWRNADKAMRHDTFLTEHELCFACMWWQPHAWAQNFYRWAHICCSCLPAWGLSPDSLPAPFLVYHYGNTARLIAVWAMLKLSHCFRDFNPVQSMLKLSHQDHFR